MEDIIKISNRFNINLLNNLLKTVRDIKERTHHTAKAMLMVKLAKHIQIMDKENPYLHKHKKATTTSTTAMDPNRNEEFNLRGCNNWKNRQQINNINSRRCLSIINHSSSTSLSLSRHHSFNRNRIEPNLHNTGRSQFRIIFQRMNNSRFGLPLINRKRIFPQINGFYD